VYYDHNDKPKHVSLSVDSTPHVITMEDRDIAIQFAFANSSNVMKELRKQHVDALDKLEAHYNTAEQALSALSNDPSFDHETYKNKLEEALSDRDAIHMIIQKCFIRSLF
jgi:translation initiation factor 2 beta subunit (eIF-2beta)/eIF-5